MTLSTSHNRTRIAIRLYSGKLLLILVFLAVSGAVIYGQHVTKQADARAFYPDDPLRVDPDRINITEPTEFPLYKDADYLINSFTHPGGDAGPALNVNSVDEVPDSSWFTNRIGLGKMTIEDIVAARHHRRAGAGYMDSGGSSGGRYHAEVLLEKQVNMHLSKNPLHQ